MPFFINENEEEEQKNKAVTPSIQGSTGQSNVKAPSKSGNFTNLQAYLNANREQASSLGNNVGTNIENLSNEAKNSVNNVSNTFNNEVNKNALGNSSTAKDEAKTFVEKASNEGIVSNGDRYKEISNYEYKGPLELDKSQYGGQVQKTNDYSKLSETDSGRFTLLKDMFNNKGNYSRGQTNLDNLLISGDTQAKNRLADARNNVSGLSSYVNDKENEAKNTALNVKKIGDEASSYSKDYLNTTRNTKNNTVETRLNDVQNNWSKEYDQYANLLNSYNKGSLDLTRDQANKLQLKGNERLYNTLNDYDAKSLLTLNEFDQNKLVTKDEFNQLSALDELAKLAQMNTTSKFNNKDLAGTMTLNDALSTDNFISTVNQADKDFKDYAKDTTLKTSASAKAPIHTEYKINAGPFSVKYGEKKSGTAKTSGSASLDLYDYLFGGKSDPNIGRNTTEAMSPEQLLYLAGTNGQGASLDKVNEILGGGSDAKKVQKKIEKEVNKKLEENLKKNLKKVLSDAGYGNQVKIR